MNNEEQIKSQVGDVSAFIDGQQDCRDGKPHQEGGVIHTTRGIGWNPTCKSILSKGEQ